MPRRKLFKYVQTIKEGDRTRSYYRRPGQELIRLRGEPGSEEFVKSYDAAAAAGPVPQIMRAALAKQAIEKVLRMSLNRSKERSKARGREFDLTLDWLLDEVKRLDFKCALTGLKFSARVSPARTDPYAPSIDRIDSKRGYPKDNVRIIIFALNVMLLDWGPTIFEHVVRHYRANKRRPFFVKPARRVRKKSVTRHASI